MITCKYCGTVLNEENGIYSCSGCGKKFKVKGDDSTASSPEPNEVKASLSFSDLGKYVFISYSTQNTDIANSFRTALEEQGVTVWMAPDSIPRGGLMPKPLERL